MSNTQNHTGEPREETHTSRGADQLKLQTIYPSAMTAEQRFVNDEARQKARDNKRIKFPSFKISLYGSFLAGLILSFVWGIEQLLMSGNISLIFATFAIGIILMFMFFAWIKYCSAVLYSYGKSLIFFLVLYVILFSGALVVWHTQDLHANLTELHHLITITCIHFVTTLIAALTLLRR